MKKVTVSDGAAAAGLSVERGEYSGKPTLSIRRGGNDKFPFSFGVGKAKMILACLDEIKAFVADIEAAAKALELAKAEKTGAGIVLATPALSVAQLEAMLAKAKANANPPATQDSILAAIAKKPSRK
jgi:hypothetical protein